MALLTASIQQLRRDYNLPANDGIDLRNTMLERARAAACEALAKRSVVSSGSATRSYNSRVPKLETSLKRLSRMA